MVEVNYLGRIGNNLFQYCLGRIIATELGWGLTSEPITGFDLAVPIPKSKPPNSRKHLLEGHVVDLNAVMRDHSSRTIVLNGFFQRYEYYKTYKHQIRQWLVSPSDQEYGLRDLTINIRSGDIWRCNNKNDVHPNYPGLPFSYYERIVRSQNWDRIHIVSDDPKDHMVLKLSKRFDGQIFSEGPQSDFSRLRSSTNIVLPVSTFSWWAAWLSHAEKIYYPVVGLFDPSIRPDINLLVDDEDRYVYQRIPRTKLWEGSEEDRQQLLSG